MWNRTGCNKKNKMIETLELDISDELDYVVTIKTKRHPNGFSYIRQDCINSQLINLNTALKNLQDTLSAKKIIM